MIRRLKEVGAIRFGEFVLSSGQKSNVYIDIKHACTYPDILKLIAELMSEVIRDVEFDKIACIELGGVPIAVALSLKLEKPVVIFRKRKKEYGVKDDCVGVVNPGERFVVVEDVTTTGKSALSVVERVKSRGGRVVMILSVVNRGANVKNLRSILRLDEITSEPS